MGTQFPELELKSLVLASWPVGHSSAQRDTFAGEQEAGILHDALQLREHLTGDEILADARDRICLEAMVLRRGRMSSQHRSGGDD
jgi:hypothetical protein